MMKKLISEIKDPDCYCIHCGDRAPEPRQHGVGICVYRCRWCGKECIFGLACTCKRAVDKQ